MSFAGKTARKIFWFIAGVGFLLPWIVIVLCQIYFGQGYEIRHFPQHLFEPGYNFFLAGLMDAAPFVMVAAAANWLLKPSLDEKVCKRRLAGLGTASASVLLLSGVVQTSVWASILNPKTHSSLAAVGLFALFWLSLAILPVAYVIGWGIARLMVA